MIAKVAFLVVALMLPPAAQAQQVIGIAELADRAGASHPAILQAEALRGAAGHSLRDAYMGFAPRANLIFDRSGERLNVIRSENLLYQPGNRAFANRGYTLEVVQPLFDARLFAQLRGSHAALRRSREELSGVRQRVLFELVQGYLTVLAAHDGLLVARAEEDVLRRQWNELRSRAQLGLSAPTDADEVEARLAQAEAQRIAAESTLNANFAALERRAGMRVGALAPLAGRIPMAPPQPVEPQPWVEMALRGNPDVRALDAAMVEARALAEQQAAALLPRFDLRFTQNRADTGGTVYGGGSVIADRVLLFRLTVPLFNPDGAGTPYFAANSRSVAARHRAADARLDIEERVRVAFEEVVSNARREATLVSALTAQQRVTLGKRQRFTAGLLRIREVLDSERDLAQAQRNLLGARYNYLLNLMMLKRLTGDFAEADILYIDGLLDRRAAVVDRIRQPVSNSINR
jgi:TolC family type I secretion outer membrane protein